MRRLLAPVLLCTSLVAAAEPAVPTLPGPPPTDSLAAGRLARSAGDAALLAALGENAPRSTALTAIRAASYATAPESLLGALCRHAVGRDSVLAPGAGLAILAIGDRLDPDALAVREVAIGDLRGALAALASVTDHEPPVRADIAFAARTTSAAYVDALSVLGVSPEAP